MANLQQAPALLSKGERFRGTNGKAIRSHDLETAIWNGLGERDMAMAKVMFFLTGQAQDGKFKVAEKTIIERCNMSERGYKGARKKLVEKGWIDHQEGMITVLYDNIYKCGKGVTENTPILEDNSEHPIEIKGCTECTPKRCTECTPKGITENTYNNIREYNNNNITEPDSSTHSPDALASSGISSVVEEPVKQEQVEVKRDVWEWDQLCRNLGIMNTTVQPTQLPFTLVGEGVIEVEIKGVKYKVKVQQ